MAKIDSIRYVGKETVYNMEVYNHHNFITKGGTILHNCRYFCISRVMAAEAIKQANELNGLKDETEEEPYEDYMLGGDVSAGYIAY